MDSASSSKNVNEEVVKPKELSSDSVNWHSKLFERFGPYRRWKHYRKWLEREKSGAVVWSRNDFDENKEGALADDEGVQVPGIWVTELYTPSTVNGLLKGISELGWDHGNSRNDSLLRWMSDVREGRSAGWTNLGLVSKPKSTHFMCERTAPLPSGVTAAQPVLMSLTSSLTAFVVLFIFDDATAKSLDTTLRAKFKTVIRRDPLFRTWHSIRYILFNGRIRLGQGIHSPDFIRREMLKVQLKQLEDNCINWVQTHLPGAFASLPDIRTPTATLLVTEKDRPLSDKTTVIRAFEGLGIERFSDAWECSEWDGAKLVMPRGWGEERNRLVFACRRLDAFPVASGYHEPTSNWTIAQRADDYISKLLSRRAITCLLDGYHQILSALRDKSAQDGKYRPVRDLKELRTLVRTKLYDINTCTQEIAEFVQSDFDYCHNVPKMMYVSGRGEKISLLSSMRSFQGKRALQVKREAELLLSTLSTSNNLSQTISNIRIQQLVVVLTLVSIFIALAASIIA